MKRALLITAFLSILTLWPPLFAEQAEPRVIGPNDWTLSPAECWDFVESNIIHPAHMAITKVGPPRNKPVRRPYTTAVIRPEAMRPGDNTISLQVQSREPENKKGRDAVVILGYVDDTHYTYVHLSNDADGRAHNVIMKVDGDERRVIQAPAKPEPRLTGKGWHRVRVTFDTQGRIEVYMDDMNEPLMTATDPGVIDKPMGVGSFNDKAAFADVVLSASRDAAGR